MPKSHSPTSYVNKIKSQSLNSMDQKSRSSVFTPQTSNPGLGATDLIAALGSVSYLVP